MTCFHAFSKLVVAFLTPLRRIECLSDHRTNSETRIYEEDVKWQWTRERSILGDVVPLTRKSHHDSALPPRRLFGGLKGGREYGEVLRVSVPLSRGTADYLVCLR